MNHYAAILNLDEAAFHCLTPDELFDQDIQSTLSRSVLLGHGQTEYTALLNALNTLQDNGILKTYECESGADCILKNSTGKKALRHLWLCDGDDGRKSILYPLPGHASAMDFCNRYHLSEEATEELARFMNILLDANT